MGEIRWEPDPEVVTRMADVLYDAYCNGPSFRAEFGDAAHWHFGIDRIRGDRDASDEMNRQPWLRAARECLRQMEYGWRQGYTAANCDQTQAIYNREYFDRCTRDYPLTLAPPEWTP